MRVSLSNWERGLSECWGSYGCVKIIYDSQVCGSMPYDDSDVKKMIKYQTERKVGFSKSKKLSDEVKELIYGILEAKVEQRYKMRDIKDSAWLQGTYRKLLSGAPRTPSAATTTATTPVATTTPTAVAGAALAATVGATRVIITTTVPDTSLRPDVASRGQDVTAVIGGAGPRARGESRPAGV